MGWFWTLAKAFVVGVLAVAPGVCGHGFISSPASRVTDATSGYTPHGISAGGPGVVYAGGRQFPNGVHGACGDASGQNVYGGGGSHFRINKGFRMTYYKAGSRVPVRITVTANHGGYWFFGLCPVPGTMAGASSTSENSVVTEACFRRNVLRLASPGGAPAGNSFFMDGGAKTPFTWAVDVMLPAGVTCKRCVLRWWWVTANSCTPPGLPAKFVVSKGMSTCGKGGSNPEEFWNCADIGIVGANETPPAPKNAGIKFGQPVSGGADGARSTGTGIGTVNDFKGTGAFTSVNAGTGTSKTTTAGGTGGTTAGGTGGTTGTTTGGTSTTGTTTGGLSTFDATTLIPAAGVGLVGGAMLGIPAMLLNPALGMMVGLLASMMASALTYLRKSTFVPFRRRALDGDDELHARYLALTLPTAPTFRRVTRHSSTHETA